VAQRVVALLVLAAAAAPGGAQGTARRLTTIAALHQYSGYYHLQNVLVHGEFVESGSQVVLRGGDRTIPVILNDTTTPAGIAEVRGQLFDVGRFDPGDPRVRAYAGAPEPERWPRPGEELILNVTAIAETAAAPQASLRAIALQPWRFDGQKVTVVGQFRGRNLFADLPSAPGKSRWDFVLRTADAALWVVDLRPRGRGFDLSVDARVDTGRWLQVSGVVTQDRGLVTIAGATVATTDAPELPPAGEETQAPPPPTEPGEVIFSTPTEGESNVPAGVTVRLQFSRGIDPASLTDRIRVTHAGTAAAEPAPAFTTSYDAGSRAVEIRFGAPFQPFRTVRIELIEGVRLFDGAPVLPWTLTFTVGGS
jgi:hypothetical protein